ncbi:tRNA delta(2)-isopentenylpyrophosphate transferase [Fictibacillus macauensis ZFHKF-1]|uniref:tRNA dimethylallyltransferase n=1 Tax=Fictibacillus macauensis ZFHKF-1 TaxID=1196324 RepID=I8UJ30_9BACL|nr:tRNA (adenosine(37)-N6)-dimethylallyltransferase MiaA [Fictibacillus macauensis]EIT86895.1 tRNA delta(2)-isopentenylpyrophosphate transferase [Fictibacillus macauensis ZFHKF-1]
MKEEVIVVAGPTAVGKTKTGIELAKALHGEIISGDSMQVYRTMDIGTAKVTKEEMEGIPHHLLDIKEPTESFSASEFQTLARACIADISSRGKVPIIVGGTGLYIRAAISNYAFSEAKEDKAYRMQLEQMAAEKGNEAVHALLLERDPKSAERIHPNNVRRVIRALEIYHITKQTMTEVLADQQPEEMLYKPILIGLEMERDLLYQRINERVDLMVERGLVQEAKALYEAGVIDCQSVQAIGYKEMYAYFKGDVSYEEAIAQLKQNSRRYAKRQYTWFRNQMNMNWFDMTSLDFQKEFKEIQSFTEGKRASLSNE